MALYINLKFTNMDRLFNLGKANDGIFITGYLENESDENNQKRSLDLKQKICNKGLAYIPVFCGSQKQHVIDEGKCCYYIINKKKNCIDDDALLSSDLLFNFGKDLCNDFNQQYFIFIDNGEVKSISKSGHAVGLFSPNVLFSNLVSSVFPCSFSYDDNEYFIRTFETMSGKMSHGMAGELFLRKEELSAKKENWINAG